MIPFPETAWRILKIALGLGPFLAGLDKFFNILANWSMYLSPLATRVVPIDPDTFMRVVGVVEMIVGLAILTRWTRLGAYVACAWLLGIAVNLLTTGMFYDLAVRDVEIAIGAFVLAQLTAARETAAGGLPRAETHAPRRTSAA
jgi:hypothetical protein